MLWMFRLPGYRTAVIERALGVLLFSPDDSPFITASKDVDRQIKTHCVLGSSIDRSAMQIVLGVLSVTIERDMAPDHALAVLRALAEWGDRTVNEHLALREQVLKGNLGSDPVLTRLLWLSSYLSASESQGSMTQEEASNYSDAVARMLADRARVVA